MSINKDTKQVFKSTGKHTSLLISSHTHADIQMYSLSHTHTPTFTHHCSKWSYQFPVRHCTPVNTDLQAFSNLHSVWFNAIWNFLVFVVVVVVVGVIVNMVNCTKPLWWHAGVCHHIPGRFGCLTVCRFVRLSAGMHAIIPFWVPPEQQMTSRGYLLLVCFIIVVAII